MIFYQRQSCFFLHFCYFLFVFMDLLSPVPLGVHRSIESEELHGEQ